jgi:hypothetical protein
MKEKTMKYEAIVSHYNGCSYSSDGEEWFDVESPDAVDIDVLIELYSTDSEGEPCDVDSVVEIYSVITDEDGDEVREVVRTISLKHSVGEAAQDDCTIIARHTDSYTESFVGTNSDDEFVKWTNNGGTFGAHDRMTNRGWIESYDIPETIDAADFLRLALAYGYDTEDDEHGLCGLIRDALRNGELDSETDTAHCLQADDSLLEIEAHAHRIGTRHVLLWTDCDGNGIDDVCIREWSGSVLREFAEEIAESIGEVVDVESGAHYSNLGLQYQPSSGYDRDGYEIVVVRRED